MANKEEFLDNRYCMFCKNPIGQVKEADQENYKLFCHGETNNGQYFHYRCFEKDKLYMKIVESKSLTESELKSLKEFLEI